MLFHDEKFSAIPGWPGIGHELIERYIVVSDKIGGKIFFGYGPDFDYVEAKVMPLFRAVEE